MASIDVSDLGADEILDVAPNAGPTNIAEVRQFLDDTRTGIRGLEERLPSRIKKDDPLKNGARAIGNIRKFLAQFFENDEAAFKAKEDEARAEEARRSELLTLRRAYIAERLVKRGPATIGFSGRTKKTKQGEARPTRVCFRWQNDAGVTQERLIEIETWEAEALATLVGVPVTWGEPIEVEDLAAYLQANPQIVYQHIQLVKPLEKLAKGEHPKVMLPIEYEDFRESDLIVAAEGSINDAFVAGMMINHPNVKIFRTSTGTLKALRTNFFKEEAAQQVEAPEDTATDGKKKRGRPKKTKVAEKLEDQTILARVAEDPAQLRRYFHPVVAADRDMVVFRMAYLEWIQRQALQVAATQRAHQAEQKRHFVDQGLLITMLASPGLDTRRSLVDNDLEVLRMLEAEAKAIMEERINALREYTLILGNKDAIDRIGPAIGGHLLFEIGNPTRFVKALADEREAVHVRITKALADTGWEDVWRDFWTKLKQLRGEESRKNVCEIAALLLRRAERRLEEQTKMVARLEAHRRQIEAEDTSSNDQEIAEHYKTLDLKDAEAALSEARERRARTIIQVTELRHFISGSSESVFSEADILKHFDKLVEKAGAAHARVMEGDTKQTHYVRLSLWTALEHESHPAYRKLVHALDDVQAARDLKKQSVSKTIGSLIAYAGVKPRRVDNEGRPIVRWQRHICSKASGDAANNGQLRRAGHLLFDQALKNIKNEGSILGRALRILRERYAERHGTTVIPVTRESKNGTYEFPMFSGGQQLGSVRWQLFSSFLAWFMKSWLEMRAHPNPAEYRPQPFDKYVEGNRPRNTELVADADREAPPDDTTES